HAGLEDGVRIAATEDLRQDVAHAGRLQDRAHGATRDDTGTLGGRLEQDLAGAELADRLVGQRRGGERNPDQVLLRLLPALADGLRHLVRLAQADADVPVAVAYDDQRREAEAPATLHHLGDAVDADDPLGEVELVRIDRLLRHLRTPIPPRGPHRP